jgi:Undecaprenyl-phosphate glucose phosphotransferase
MEGATKEQVRPALEWPETRIAVRISDDAVYSRSPRSRADREFEEKLPGILCVADAGAIFFAGLAVLFLLRPSGGAHFSIYGAGVAGTALLGANCFAWCGSYRRDRLIAEVLARPQVHLARLGGAGAFAILLLSLWRLPDRDLEPMIAVWLAFVALLIGASRFVLRSYLLRLKRQGHLTPTLALVGNGAAALDLIGRMPADAVAGCCVLGVFSSAQRAETHARTVDELVELARTTYLDEIRIVLASRAEQTCAALIRELCVLPVDITIDLGGVLGSPSGASAASRMPPVTVLRRPLWGWNATVKRAEDLLIGGLLLLSAAPIFALIMLSIKLDSAGPVFFRQERFGFNNNRIMVWKFRTMSTDLNPDPMVPQARRNDDRITRFGGFLRRTSLDELPQLLNVLCGEMSLVGPRPHASAHNEKYGALIDGYLARHRVKPGITGWAQVRGLRGETTTLEPMRRRVDHDLYYIENWSFLFDLQIILRTVPAMISGENAY